VGPYGRLAKNLKKATPKKPFIKGAPSSNLLNTFGDSELETKRKPGVDIGGAALCVYRGHSYNTPIWDCRFAPSGYYFATCSGDTTGKIWTTDRPTPVRSLVGHLSSVNCIAWHPNVNYVVTGSDDKTCRMWDVQTGRCVRVLTGFHGWVSSLEVCPSGKYVAAADETGLIGMYDLAR
jgi:transcription initiation factor TFIID subunit 5